MFTPRTKCRDRRDSSRVLAFSMIIFSLIGMSLPVSAATSVSLQLHWTHQFEFAGYYAALENGYYRDVGLEVTIRSGGPGVLSVESVVDGDAEFGVASSELLLARLRGQPVVALAPIFQHSAAAMLVTSASQIRTPQDMHGKRVEMGDLSSDAEVRAMLRSEGVSMSGITHIPSTFSTEALAQGRSDVMSAYVTNQPYQLQAKNIPMRLIKPLTYGIDFYGDTLFTSETVASQQRPLVQDFLRASLKGWDYAFQNSEQMIDLIIEKYPNPGLSLSREKLRFERDQMLDLVLPELIEIGQMNDSRWKHMADTFVDLGIVGPGFELSGFSFNPQEEVFNWGHLYVRIGAVVAGVLLLMSVFLSYFNRRLRQEVEQRWLVEEKLQDSENRLILALWGANLGCWDWDLDSSRVYVDARAAKMLSGGTEAMDVDINQDSRIAEIFQSLQEEMDTEEVKAERYIKLASDSHWVLIRGRRLINSSGLCRAFGTVMDVSAEHAYQEKLVKLSITDPLTGLLNRRYFFDRLTQSCSQSKRDGNLIAIALLDIDHFKDVNDQYGHLAGDQTLVQFSQMLKEDCRPYDLVSRFGGEEFIILFYGMDKMQAYTVLERYQEMLRTTQIVADGHRLYCTFSCGIADSTEIGPGELETNTLVKLADERLYFGKKHGRNQIVSESAA